MMRLVFVCALLAMTWPAHGQPKLSEDVNRTCTADATAHLVAYMRATPPGGTMLLGPGCFLISGTGAEIFGRTTSIHIKGNLHGTKLLIASGTSPVTDIFRFVPVGPGESYDWSIDGVTISSQAPGHGRHILNLDTSGASSLDDTRAKNRFLGGMRFLNNYIDASVAGDAIHFSPSTPGIGMFRFYLENSVVNGNVEMDGAGDSIWVTGNILTGASARFYLNQVPGAGNFVFTKNNFSMAGGLVIDGGAKPIIAWNEFEQQAPTVNPHGALIDLSGASSNIDTGLIESNQLQANAKTGIAGANAPNLIRVNAASNILIAQNRFGQTGPAPVREIVITARANGTVVRDDNVFVGSPGLAHIDDKGANTRRGPSEMLYAAASDPPRAANTAASTELRAVRLPPGRLQPGDVIRLRGTGLFTAQSGAVLALRGNIGGKPILSASSSFPGPVSSGVWTLETDIIVRAIGADGNLVRGFSSVSLQSGITNLAVGNGTVALDPAAGPAISLSVNWERASAANAIFCTAMTVELLHAGSMN